MRSTTATGRLEVPAEQCSDLMVVGDIGGEQTAPLGSVGGVPRAKRLPANRRWIQARATRGEQISLAISAPVAAQESLQRPGVEDVGGRGPPAARGGDRERDVVQARGGVRVGGADDRDAGA